MRCSLGVAVFCLTLAWLPVAHGVEVYYANSITSANYSDAGSDLGNAGYWFAVFNRTGGANNLAPDANAANALPAYVSQSFGPTVDGSGGWGGYFDITLPNGTLGNSGALELNNAPSGPAGTRAEYMTLTFGAGTPSKLRLGVVADNGDGLQWSNTQIIVNDSSTGTLTNNLSPDVHFFDLLDISPGDTVQIDGVTAGATVSHLGGILLDPLVTMDLEVNTGNGQVTLLSPTTDLDIQGYSIASAQGSLDPGGWSALEGKAGFGNGNATDGVGWEKLGSGIATQVGEYNLLGSTVFGPSGEGDTSIGSLFADGGQQDLRFQYTTADGSIYNGLVTYVDTPGLAGDYNGDNVVDAGDYVVWRNSVGEMGAGLPADGNGDGTVNGADYTYWKQRFGNTAPGSLAVAPANVPEPAAILLLGLAVPATLLRRRAIKTLGFVLVGLVAATTAYADRSPDRLYRFGDEPGEGPQDNQLVGSGNGFGLTFDSVGMGGDGSLQDLSRSGTVNYTNVVGRPQAGTSQWGASFTGSGYLQQNVGLGYPGANPGPNPAENYLGITSRGMQAWVNPTDTDTLQYIVYDTAQFGIRVNANGTWGMVWGAANAGSTGGRGYSSTVPVAFGEWSHVHQHSYGNERGVLYVNGVAVATSAPGQIYQIVDSPSLQKGLVVGGDVNTLNTNLYSGLIDELELYVSGNSFVTQMDFGTFNLGEDNWYIASLGLTDGDLTGDDVVNDADVNIFVNNWRMEQLVMGRPTGDLNSRNFGDFNYDGVVGLADWYILATNHVNGASLNLAELLANGSATVPEPATVGLLVMAGTIVFRRRLFRCLKGVAPLAALLLMFAGQSALAAGLWNVDFQGDIAGTIFGQTATQKNYGPDEFGVWNHFEVAGLSANPQPTFSTDPSLNLVDNDGNASPVTITLNGMYAGWNGDATRTDDLRGDYIILLGNGALDFPAPPLNMTISGLTPGQRYGMNVITGTESTVRDLLVTVDVNGNGSLADDVAVVAPSNGVSTGFSFTAPAGGSTTLTMNLNSSNEGNLAGLQLKLGDFYPVLTVNRQTGQMTISNNTAQTASVMGYSIESDTAGALLPSQWLSVTDNYDANSGTPTVDPNFAWRKFTTATDREFLSEVQEIGGTGTNVVDGQSVNLGNAWIRSPLEDLTGEVLLSDGTVVPLDVRFTGNALIRGDLNFDQDVDLADWALFKAGFSTDPSSFTAAERYGAGDLTLDGVVDLKDVLAFEAAFDSMQGAGAFAAAVGNVAGVPEPGTVLTMVLLTGVVAATRRYRGVA